MSDSKTIVITGVTRGLGLAMARYFATHGHTVIGCGRSASLVAELQQELGSQQAISVVDVTDERAVAAWAEASLAKFGAPDLLLNSAAIINANNSLWNVPTVEFARVVDINIKGVFHVTKHFAPAMIARQSGVIVNFSSGWGRSTSAEVAPYCATKYAIEGLTLALAAELPSGMAAIPLNPGVIATDMLQSCFGEDASSYPQPAAWAQVACPYLLQLSARHNGRSLSVPM